MASQWQGSLLWWSFYPQGDVESFVEDSLKRFVSGIVTSEPAGFAMKRQGDEDIRPAQASQYASGP